FIAQPDPGSSVSSWTWPACGSQPSCTIPVESARMARVDFGQRLVTLDLTVGGADANGFVSVSPNTGGPASPYMFPSGTTVTLTASASAPRWFGGWSGDCSGF